METKVNVQGGTIRLPDGTNGYFKSEYVKNCSDITYHDIQNNEKYIVKINKSDGRCLIFHNNDLNKDFIVPLSDQIEKYGINYLAQIVNPLVVEVNSGTTVVTFSVNSESILTKYDPSKLYKMFEENSNSCINANNIVTVFSALMKFEKCDEGVIPVCVSIKLQNNIQDTFVNDIGGGNGNSIVPVAKATVVGGKVVSLQDLQTGKSIKIPQGGVILPVLSTAYTIQQLKSVQTLVYAGKVQVIPVRTGS